MSLFGIGKKAKAPAPKRQEPKSERTVLYNKTFTQSDSFKGFRRIKLTTYKEKGVESTLSYFEKKEYDFTGAKIRLEHISVSEVFVNEDMRVVNVYVSGKRIGCVYNTNGKYDLLADGNFDQVHIKYEDGNVYLFVHLSDTVAV